MLSLIMKSDGERERVFPMASSQMTIGRDVGCDLQIPLPEISDTHCRIRAGRSDGTLAQPVLECLDSQSGTLINGVRVDQAVLENEDIVQIGPVVFHVSISDAPDGRVFEIRREDPDPTVR